MANKYIFTSESVTEGHPDKVCDKVSDSVLDEAKRLDPGNRVACETLTTEGLVVVTGEVSQKCIDNIDFEKTARETVRKIGYTASGIGFHADEVKVDVRMKPQSGDISQGVDGTGLFKEQGAGDQGMMFGYATREGDSLDGGCELMPVPIFLAHKLARRLTDVRKNGTLPQLYPDGKTQVSVEYEDGRPVAIRNVVVSSHHARDYKLAELRTDILEQVVIPVLAPTGLVSEQELHAEKDNVESRQVYINPTGAFCEGGPKADAGLTGRKIIVDTYGGMGRHGGGAFSGKDPSKVDRSAAYMARYVAKNVVAAGLASVCEVELAYAIGVAEPVSVYVQAEGNNVPVEKIAAAIREVFDLKPAVIIDTLQLLRPIYELTAAYGHFGRTEDTFTWERTDKVDALKSAAGM
ncbi:MAG: methionine adenosyltransferase [Candidatus Glassbacteria bacterium]|nr:methionine adenosyltransferase [Candidatus Glassbacteria bacterium]